jgi:hypothetical protein
LVPLAELETRHIERLVEYAKRKADEQRRIWETAAASFELELHRRGLREYDDQLIEMAADPLNGAAKDFTEIPPHVVARLRRQAGDQDRTKSRGRGYGRHDCDDENCDEDCCGYDDCWGVW